MRPRGSKSRLQLDLPDPSRAGAAWLAWLSKQSGNMAELSDCESKWKIFKKMFPSHEFKDIGLTKFISDLGPELIIKRRWPRGEFVEIRPKGINWASNWAIEYDVARGHHGGPVPKKY